MDLDQTDRIPAAPDAVVAALTDHDYLVAYVAELGAELERATIEPADDGTVTTTVTAGVATTGVPPVFAKIVGDRISVTDTRTYAADRGSATVTVEAAVGGRRVDVAGTVRFVAAGESGAATDLCTRATIDAHVPLVGGQVASAVHGLLTGRVLAAQTAVLTRRLS